MPPAPQKKKSHRDPKSPKRESSSPLQPPSSCSPHCAAGPSARSFEPESPPRHPPHSVRRKGSPAGDDPCCRCRMRPLLASALGLWGALGMHNWRPPRSSGRPCPWTSSCRGSLPDGYHGRCWRGIDHNLLLGWRRRDDSERGLYTGNPGIEHTSLSEMAVLCEKKWEGGGEGGKERRKEGKRAGRGEGGIKVRAKT